MGPMCLWQSVDVEANLAITRYLDIQIQPILPGGATCIAKLPGIVLFGIIALVGIFITHQSGAHQQCLRNRTYETGQWNPGP